MDHGLGAYESECEALIHRLHSNGSVTFDDYLRVDVLAEKAIAKTVFMVVGLPMSEWISDLANVIGFVQKLYGK